MTLNKEEIEELSKTFEHCINYESDEFDAPIDPLSYVDSNGDSCLHLAAFRSDLRTIKLLLKGGININSLGDMGQTALDYANRKASVDVVNFLIENGAQIGRDLR